MHSCFSDHRYGQWDMLERYLSMESTPFYWSLCIFIAITWLSCVYEEIVASQWVYLSSFDTAILWTIEMHSDEMTLKYDQRRVLKYWLSMDSSLFCKELCIFIVTIWLSSVCEMAVAVLSISLSTTTWTPSWTIRRHNFITDWTHNQRSKLDCWLSMDNSLLWRVLCISVGMIWLSLAYWEAIFWSNRVVKK